MGKAGFLTRSAYCEALDNPDYIKIRRALKYLDEKIGVWYAEPLKLRASEHWSRKFELPWAICEALPLTGMSCLDIGSGFSSLPVFLAANSKRLLSLDLAPSSHSRAILLDYGGEQAAADIRTYEPSERFDRIFCISVLEHIGNCGMIGLLKKVQSWLAPDGRLIATVDVRLPGGTFGFEITDLVKLMQHFGKDVTVPLGLLSSSDFGEEGKYVGGNIGVFCLVLEECNG